MNFTPRLNDDGLRTSPLYNQKSYNSFADGKHNMPNCTCYAFGRAMEIEQAVEGKADKDLLWGTSSNLGNAKEWYLNLNKNLKRGNDPKLGAIAVFDGAAGHVAIVEAINGNQVTLSYSEYKGVYFETYTTTLKVGVSVPAKGWGTLLGYVYLPWEFTADNLAQYTAQYTDEQLADMVIQGKFGNGADRKQALGNRYSNVQSIVNAKLNGKKSVDEVAREVIQGKWGNGEERKKKLTQAGYDYEKVQARVNELM